MKRTILERFDVPDSNYETVMVLVELPPGANTGLHTHPGFDVAYLIEGDGYHSRTTGQDVRPRSIMALAPGVIHEVKAGREPVKAVGAYIVEKGKPMLIPYDPV